MNRFDEMLVGARAGDEWAWAQLYVDLAPRVAAYLRAHGTADPEDLVGEVLLHVVGRLGTFDGGQRQLRAWVLTIAHRRLVDELRRRARRPVTPAEPETLEAAAGAGGDVREDAEAMLDLARVRAAIDGLTADQRAVLLLRILGDLTVEEAARVLGKRPGAVKALQRRALRQMQEAYPFPALDR